MKLNKLHNWQLTTVHAKEIQYQIASRVSRKNEVTNPRFIAGLDISVTKEQAKATATAVVLNFPKLEVAEVKTVQDKLNFPYIPGYLSFREAPLTLKVCEQLDITPDLVIVDGHGIAHPRRLGLASHLGLFLEIPTIGCGKSLLCGDFTEPGNEPGSYTDVLENGETIGVALRTKSRVKPVFVSIGHKIDLNTAIKWIMNCCRGYRLPEPTRLAHQAAGGNKTHRKGFVISECR